MSRIADPGPKSATRLFQVLRWRRLRHTIRDLYGNSSRPISILLCCLVIWCFGFFVSYEGFTFVQNQKLLVSLKGGLIGTVFDTLFFTLSVMLVFSTGIILYGSLFSSRETPFLLSTPIPDDHVFSFKFQGAIAFSSSAFLLLGSPLLLAYGIVADAPWYFYPMTLVFFLGFILLPGAVGAILCLLLANYLPRQRKHVVLVSMLTLILIGTASVYSFMNSIQTRGLAENEVQQLLRRFEFSTSTLAPSHWIGWGLISLARGDLPNSMYYLALICTNGALLYLLTTWLASRLYRRAYNRLSTGGSQRRQYRENWWDRTLDKSLFFVDPRMRLLIIKDFRTFRRDPTQWGQILLFFGLMGVYFLFLNSRRIFIEDLAWGPQNGLSAINLIAISFLLCAYQGRFVYPLLSLEGRKFWILGLLPLSREKILWSKFAFASAISLIIAETLIIASGLVLGVPFWGLILHIITIGVLSLGLSGLSVGLGALMPNFRETDPSKIAVGFGGTVNLVVGLGYLLLLLATMTGPWHVMLAMRGSASFGLFGVILLIVGLGAGFILGAIAVILPLRMGAKNLREMEI